MFYNHVHYELCCNNCKFIKPPNMVVIRSDNRLDHYLKGEDLHDLFLYETDDELCPNCLQHVNWTALSAYVSEIQKPQKRVKIEIRKENGQIYWNIENDTLPSTLIKDILILIKNKAEGLEDNYKSQPNGFVYIFIDLIERKPYARVSMLDIDGFSINEMNEAVDKTFKSSQVISYETKIKLQNAFEEFKNDSSNPIIIAHLQNINTSINIYLIAKDTNEEIYYGIFENEFAAEIQIERISLEKIQEIEVEEIPMTPIRTRSIFVFMI